MNDFLLLIRLETIEKLHFQRDDNKFPREILNILN